MRGHILRWARGAKHNNIGQSSKTKPKPRWQNRKHENKAERCILKHTSQSADGRKETQQQSKTCTQKKKKKKYPQHFQIQQHDEWARYILFYYNFSFHMCWIQQFRMLLFVASQICIKWRTETKSMNTDLSVNLWISYGISSLTKSVKHLKKKKHWLRYI